MLATVVALFVATAVALAASGLAFGGSCVLAAGIVAAGFVYLGVGAISCQLMPTRRGALELGGALLGADFTVRVIADTTNTDWLRWSPLAWVEQVHAFSGPRPAVLLLPVAATVVLLWGAAAMNRRRDVGAAWFAPHDTAPTRTRLLSSPITFGFRTERVSLATWGGAVFAFAFLIGTIAKSVADAIPADLRKQFSKLGGIDIASAQGYIGLTFVFFVFAIALFVCGQLAMLRDDESQHRLETLFALPYLRTTWLLGRLLLTLAAVIALSLAAGLGAAAGATASGASVSLARTVEGGLNCVPACVLFLGAGGLLIATVPRHAVGALYGFVGAAFVWHLFGALLNAPSWMLDLSPFHHVAPTPAKPVALLSAAAMTALGVAAAAVALVAFRDRDLVGD